MAGKIVAQLNHEGIYVGPVVADECQIVPGVFHIPAGAIDTELPEIPQHHYAKWDNNSWVFIEIPKPIVNGV